MATTALHPVTDVRREPVVPWDPAGGWARADRLRRACALAALPLLVLLCLVAFAGGQPATVALWAWVLIGPTTFYALARVLRPEPRSWERTPRHALAGAGTSFGLPAVAAILATRVSSDTGSGGALIILFGSMAFALGAVTTVWGLVAWAVRERRY